VQPALPSDYDCLPVLREEVFYLDLLANPLEDKLPAMLAADPSDPDANSASFSGGGSDIDL